MIRHISIIIKHAIIICILFAANTAFAAVSAIVDRSQVYTGDAFTLTIRSSGRDSASPDLSVLNTDFIVLGTGKSTQVSINNGRRTDSSSWTINLKAKNKGTVTIPAITVGQDKTSPLVISVVDIPPQISAKMAQRFFIEVEADTSSAVYVQQQIPLTVRFYHDGSIVKGTLTQPTADDAVIETLGRENTYTSNKNGKNFQVVERHYTVSAEKSGDLTIAPVLFDGRMRTGQTSQRRSNNPFAIDPFFNRQPTQPVHAKSQATVIKILPRSGIDGSTYWLPAEEVILEDSWIKTPPGLISGEPVTRTITVKTKGPGASQLPEIDIQKPANTHMYIDKPESRTQTDGKTLYAISQVSITYIPQQSGSLLIPEISLNWWNTKSNQKQTSRLAEHRLEVAAGAGFNISETNVSPPAPESPNATKDDEALNPGQDQGSSRWLYWLLLSIFIVTGLAIGIRQLGSRYLNNRNPDNAEPPADPNKILEQLRLSCKNDMPNEAAHLLLEFCAALWPDKRPLSLRELAGSLEVGDLEILQLERVLYDANVNSWRGQPLLTLLDKGLNRKQQQASPAVKDSILKPLYPSS